jgi:hypothetical protein
MAGADAIMMRRHPVSVRPVARVSGQPRPSPFHPVAPEIEVTQTLPAHAVTARAPVPVPAAAQPVTYAEPPKESRLGRFLSKIPLLRHLRKHPPAEGTPAPD